MKLLTQRCDSGVEPQKLITYRTGKKKKELFWME